MAQTDMDIDHIIEADAVAAMTALPAESVDMVFADPPYNLQLEGELLRPNNTPVDGVDDAWDRFGDFAAYDAFSRAWLAAARRLLKPHGTLWVIGTYHNVFRIGSAIQDLGFWILNDVIWRKTNPMPNFRGRRFTNAHETLIWCARERGARHRFNYRAMKHLNDDLQMRSDWLLPLCTGPERLRSNGRKAHPTQKPEALLHRCILSATNPGDLVLDPFLGSGTTAAVAKRLGRHWIGIERDPDYVRLAGARIASVTRISDTDLAATPERRSLPRIPFGMVVERGLLHPGEVLTDQRQRFVARVAADGTLAADGVRGSIHHVGAFVQGAAACNGWQFWHANQNGQRFPIDQFRQKLRAELH